MIVFNKSFLVLGVSKSGFSVCNYVIDNGGVCYFFEQLNNKKVSENIDKLLIRGAIKVENNYEEILEKVENVIISPGVPINHEIAIKAKEKNKNIMGELEFGFNQLLPLNISVTGTNGKTTTVSLIDYILNASGYNSVTLGNIGNPVCDYINNIFSKTICVTEVSSFQLESINNYHPNIACILNITPDHLERHYTMENYIFLKKRLLKNQNKDDFSLLNFDDETVKAFSVDLQSKIIYISLKQQVNGAYKKNNSLYFLDEKIIDTSELSLKGEHNEYNCLFAIAVCKILGLNKEQIKKGLVSFKGIPNRIELISEKDDIFVYNDSKATNTASTISAISSIDKPIVLILGGREKGETYDELFEKIKNSNVKQVVLTGESVLNMLSCAISKQVKNVSYFSDFYSAVKNAYSICEKGDALLLSPACASFDLFSGYAERGDAFRKTIWEMTGENKNVT